MAAERCPAINDGQQCVLEVGHAGLHVLPQPVSAPAVTGVPGDWGGAPATMAAQSPKTRRYRGSLAKATAAFQHDAANMAKSGWYPTSQAYAPGSWGCGYFLIALLLCLVLVGILIFIYMLIVKPDGELVVTYEYRPPIAAPVDGVPVAPPIDPASDLTRLIDLRDRGLIAPEEYAAKRAEIVARL